MDASAKPPVAADLLAWYDAHARVLPWRAPPGSPPPDPYRVWLSEIMLQQTTAAAVAPYFERFVARWPDVAALAAADDGDVMAAWAGLGYYARARNLLAAARAVTARGGFPTDEGELRTLPGLGDYTAAAIAAIAFGKRAVVVDGNVARVVSRLFAIADPLPARTAIRAATNAITPDARAGDFAQAMMDLGATVCTPKSPRCIICPLARHCRAMAEGDPARYPVRAAKPVRPERRGTAFWIEQDEQVWLVRRDAGGLLGAMRALPDDGWSARADGGGLPPLSGPWADAGSVSHVFTHFALRLRVRVYSGSEVPQGDGEWWPVRDIERAGLPTVFAKAARRALAGMGGCER